MKKIISLIMALGFSVALNSTAFQQDIPDDATQCFEANVEAWVDNLRTSLEPGKLQEIVKSVLPQGITVSEVLDTFITQIKTLASFFGPENCLLMHQYIMNTISAMDDFDGTNAHNFKLSIIGHFVSTQNGSGGTHAPTTMRSLRGGERTSFHHPGDAGRI